MKSTLSLVGCILMLGAYAHGVAVIQIDPVGYDFGEVDMGASVSTTLTIYSTGDTPLAIDDVYFLAGSSMDFSITSLLYPPIILGAGGLFSVEITFAPSVEGSASAVLVIESNDLATPVLEVDLTGSAPYGEQTPEEQIEAIIGFVDEAVMDGTLEGEGPGRSAANRLGALENMLDRAQDLIDEGKVDEAIMQLESIYKKTDGMDKPGDFVTGAAAVELSEMILELLETLEEM